MNESSPVLRSRSLRYAMAVAGLTALIWLVRLFHVVPLGAAKQQAATAEFDAASYVDVFWSGPLGEAAANAVEATELLEALTRDFDAAAERFGHRLGLGSTSYFLVRGRGRIIAIEDMAVRVELEPQASAEIVIGTGPVFGSAIRDGAGLLDVSDFANIQDFNAISAELNRRVEEHVLPTLREQGAVGSEVAFVGGIELNESGRVPSTINLVPVVIEFP